MSRKRELIMYTGSIFVLGIASIPLYRVNKFNSGIISGLAFVMFLFSIPYHPRIITELAIYLKKEWLPKLKYSPLIPLIVFVILFWVGYAIKLYLPGLCSIFSIFIMVYLGAIIDKAKELSDVSINPGK